MDMNGKLAADQRYAVAEYNLGLMHEDGLRVEDNRYTALRWFKRASEHGDKDAAFAVSRLELIISHDARMSESINSTTNVFNYGRKNLR
jgi:TPR repeat protein